jgi:hypothetical protein
MACISFPEEAYYPLHIENLGGPSGLKMLQLRMHFYSRIDLGQGTIFGFCVFSFKRFCLSNSAVAVVRTAAQLTDDN